jgi:hypothetical protein
MIVVNGKIKLAEGGYFMHVDKTYKHKNKIERKSYGVIVKHGHKAPYIYVNEADFDKDIRIYENSLKKLISKIENL